MIVYKVVDLFGVRKRFIKERRSDKNARRYSKRYRRMWFWHEDRWNQRQGIKSEQWQEWQI
jgi:hypothetical protein